jgi:hypothetical protein
MNDLMKDIEKLARAAFDAGVRAGFGLTQEGFNGECAFEHLIPSEGDGTGADPFEFPEFKEKIDAIAARYFGPTKETS